MNIPRTCDECPFFRDCQSAMNLKGCAFYQEQHKNRGLMCLLKVIRNLFS